jgi:hypothetical protein
MDENKICCMCRSNRQLFNIDGEYFCVGWNDKSKPTCYQLYSCKYECNVCRKYKHVHHEVCFIVESSQYPFMQKHLCNTCFTPFIDTYNEEIKKQDNDDLKHSSNYWKVVFHSHNTVKDVIKQNNKTNIACLNASPV